MIKLSEQYCKRLESFLKESEMMLEYNVKGTVPPKELLNRFRTSRNIISLGLSNAIAKHNQKPIKGRFYLLSGKLVFIKKITNKSVEFKRVRDDGTLTPGNFHLSHKETEALSPAYQDDEYHLFVDDHDMVLLMNKANENIDAGTLEDINKLWNERKNPFIINNNGGCPNCKYPLDEYGICENCLDRGSYG